MKHFDSVSASDFSHNFGHLIFKCSFTKENAFVSSEIVTVLLFGNRSSRRPIRSVIILVITQIGLPLRGRPILLITRMNTDRIELPSVLLITIITHAAKV